MNDRILGATLIFTSLALVGCERSREVRMEPPTVRQLTTGVHKVTTTVVDQAIKAGQERRLLDQPDGLQLIDRRLDYYGRIEQIDSWESKDEYVYTIGSQRGEKSTYANFLVTGARSDHASWIARGRPMLNDGKTPNNNSMFFPFGWLFWPVVEPLVLLIGGTEWSTNSTPIPGKTESDTRWTDHMERKPLTLQAVRVVMGDKRAPCERQMTTDADGGLRIPLWELAKASQGRDAVVIIYTPADAETSLGNFAISTETMRRYGSVVESW